MSKRLLSMFLALCMVVSMLPVTALAEEIHTTIGGSGEIISFAPLTETAKAASLGTSIEDLELPETLTATVRTAMPAAENPTQDSGSTETATPTAATEPEWVENTVDIPVKWESTPEYDMETEGAYVFTPVIEGYTVSADLPEITVIVGTPAIAARGMQPQAIAAGDVAGIDSMGYATLQAAVDAVADGQTIQLLDNITLAATVNIPSSNSNSFTLDLNGKTLNVGFASAIKHLGSGALTITDSAGGGMVTSGTMGTIFASGSGTVNISGGTINAIGGTEYVAIWVGSNNTLNITDGMVSATGFLGIAIYSQNGIVNVSGGTVSATGTNGKAILGEIGAAGQLSISGGTVSAAGTGGIAIDHVNATIQNGTTIIIQGSSRAMTSATTLNSGVQGGASTNYDGSGSVAYNAANIETYKYLKFGLDVISPVLSAGNVNRTNDTAATIGFTTDKAGTAYYLCLLYTSTPHLPM